MVMNDNLEEIGLLQCDIDVDINVKMSNLNKKIVFY